MTSSITDSSTPSNAAKWTQADDDLLRANYLKPWPELLALLPGRSHSSVYQRLYLKLKIKKPRDKSYNAWSDEDVAYLRESYGKVPHAELSKRLGRNEHAIIEYARKRGLCLIEDGNGRTVNTVDKPSLRPLLEGGLQGYYWMGYLMADGYMHHGLGQIVLVSADRDKDHMASFATFLRAKCHRYVGTGGFTGLPTVHHRVSVAETSVAPDIATLYDWRPRKTYNPPSVAALSRALQDPTHFLAFFIGFMDGDGHITAKEHGRVENHRSWLGVHDFMLDTLRSAGLLDIAVKAKVNSDGYSDFDLPKRLVRQLKSFIVQHGLHVLNRKWGKVAQPNLPNS